MRQFLTQDHEGKTLHEVRDHGPEHRHVEQGAADDRAAILAHIVDHDHHDEADDGADQQRVVRNLVRAVGDRQPPREVAGPRERIDLTAHRIDDGVETGDQADQSADRQEFRQSRNGDPESVEQRLSGRAEVEGAMGGAIGVLDPDAGVEEGDQRRGNRQGQDAQQQAFRHVLLRIVRFFRRQRQLLDGEEQPHRKRHRGKHAHPAERHERSAAFRQLDRRAGRGVDPDVERPTIEVEVRDRADPEDDQNRQGHQGDDHADLEAELDAEEIEAEEDHIADDPPDPGIFGCRWKYPAHVCADEEHDHRRRDDVLDVLRNPGQVAAPWPHRAAGEGIGGAGVRQGR